MEEFQEAINRKEELERKLILAKIVNQKLTENVESTRNEREKESAKTEMLKQHCEDLMKAEQYAEWHANKIKLDLKRRTALNNEMQKLVENFHQNPLANDVEKAEKAFSSFYSDMANAPWLPEKRQIQEEHKQYSDELSKVRESVAEYGQIIAKTKEEAELHAKLPFKTFCLTLANYHNKSTKIRQLTKKEEGLSKKLKEKLLSVDDGGMLDSGEQDETAEVGGVAVTAQQQRVEEEGILAENCQQQPMDEEDNGNDIVGEQQQFMEEDDQQLDTFGVQQQQPLQVDIVGSQNVVFATPVPPPAPRCCDDGDPQPLFDFFADDNEAHHQSGVDGSFNFGSFMTTTLAGPSAKKGSSQQKHQAAPGDSQSGFNFDAFLGKPTELSKDGTGGLFDFNF